MTLHVFTARISSRDPDRLDVTRGAIDAARRKRETLPPGGPWAPSRALLQPVLDIRARVHDLMRRAQEAERVAPLTEASRLLDAAWDTYVEGYLAEMRVSYHDCRACPPYQTELISTQRQSKAARMHRVAASRLAEALRHDPEIHPHVIRVVPRAALRRAG